MNDTHFSVQNIIDANGISISVVGIVVVFFGLFLIFIFINSLPFLLRIADALFSRVRIKSSDHGHGGHAIATTPKTAEPKSKSNQKGDKNLAAAIAYVVAAELELEALSDYTKITIRRDDSQQIWGVAGKMRTLANRKINFNK
jgi:hypothetical protein